MSARYLIKHGVTGKTVGYSTVKRDAISKSKAYTVKHGVQSYVCDTINDNAQVHISKPIVADVKVVNAMLAAATAEDKAQAKAKTPTKVKPAPVCLARPIGWYGLIARLGGTV